MKNRISVLFSVILGALLITSCSNVFQPNKKVADIEVKASLSGTLARETGSSTRGDDYIDRMLASSDNEDTFTYYEIITTLTGPDYGLTEEQACDILAEKLMENSDFSSVSGNEDFWIQIRTNLGQESEKVYPYAKQVDSIKSYYKSLIQITFNYYKDMEILGFDLSSGEPDEASLENYNPLTLLKLQQLSEEYSNKLKNLTWPVSDFNLSTVSLKLNSVPFDQEVTFTLLISFNEKEEPIPYTFTRFVNPGLNVFDVIPGETTDTGDDVIDDDNDDSGSTTSVEEPDPDVVDPWEGYTTYYVSNSPAEGATGTEDDPMSLTDAFSNCTDNYDEKGTIYAIILKDDITISTTCTVPESAYIVITGNYDTSTKTIQAGERLENNMFSIDNYANLGLSSINLKGNTYCQLFYCSNSASEEDTVTESEGDTVTESEGETVTSTKSPTGTLTMENCTVTDFLGTQDVGIITMATGGEMAITGCTFYNNYVCATGAIYLISGTLNLNIDDLLDSSLSSLSTIKTNSFIDTKSDDSPCEIYLKGTGTFNKTNIFTNTAIYAVHVAGWTELTLNGTYCSGTEDPLIIYSTTDGSISNEKSKNTINVDDKEKVTIDDGGDTEKKTPTYTLTVINE